MAGRNEITLNVGPIYFVVMILDIANCQRNYDLLVPMSHKNYF